MLLMSSLPPLWETFVTTMCNVSTAAIKYTEVISSILTEAARRKSVANDSASEAYVVEGSTDQPNSRGRSSSDRRTMCKVGASRGIIGSKILARNPGISRSIVAPLKQRRTKLRELIIRLTGMRKSTTSAHQPKY